MYSDSQALSTAQGKAIISTDLFTDCEFPTFVRWHAGTKNTPYTDGLTYGTEGFAFIFGYLSGYHTVIAFPKGGKNAWAHYYNGGKDCGWSEYAQKADMNAMKNSGAQLGGINFYTVDNNQSSTVIRKITAITDTDHLTGILIIDQNRSVDIYAVGRISGVKAITKTSNADSPSVSGNVLSIPLNGWSAATFIAHGSATIS